MNYNSTTRFSNKVDNYIKYRPHYPPEVIDYLKSQNILNDSSVIADIGSGTGISTEMFLKNGNITYGVEPNKEMREAAERLLADYKNFVSVSGTAEDTTLPTGIIDLVTVGQAFHWFDVDKARVEFKRILKPGGYTVLIWNERKIDTTPFLRDYEQLLLDFGTDFIEVKHGKIDDSVFKNFFDNGYTTVTFENEQVFDFEGIKGRLLSASYVPEESSPTFQPMLNELRRMFDEHNHNGIVTVEYSTEVTSGKL